MNPWDILAWVAVACIATVIVAITCAVVVGAIKGVIGSKRKDTRIF